MKEVDWRVRAFTMNLFVFQLSKKPLAAVEFVVPLARIDPIYKEEEEAFKVIVLQQRNIVNHWNEWLRFHFDVEALVKLLSPSFV